jgi:hypothetical protein
MIDGEDEDETLTQILEAILTWRLTDTDWEAVDQELRILVEARTGADLQTFRRAANQLINYDGSRAAGGLADAPAEPPRRPASSEIREVVYRLLRQVGLPKDAPGASDDGAA